MNKLERDLRNAWRSARMNNPDRLMGCSFSFNGRFRRRLGVCRTRRSDGKPVSVELAACLLKDPRLERQAWDTFYHEVAHALVGHDAGPGPEWKAACVKLGARPERLARLNETEREAMQTVNQPKWTVGCERCGTSGQRHRFNERAVCGKCNGGLTWKDNKTGRRRRTVPVAPDFVWKDGSISFGRFV